MYKASRRISDPPAFASNKVLHRTFPLLMEYTGKVGVDAESLHRDPYKAGEEGNYLH